MSTQEIVAEINELTAQERQEIIASLNDLDKPALGNPAGSVKTGETSKDEENIPVGLRGFKKSKATTLREVAEAEGIEEEPLWKILARFAGTAEGLPEDMAINHDHYLYGTPKQKP